jgi:Pretoxin HINT domain
MLAVEMLGQIDCPSSSHALAGLSLYSNSREVRCSAIEQLKRRDPRDFVDALIELLRRPLEFEMKTVGDHKQPGVLIVEGENSRSKRIYKVPQVVSPIKPTNVTHVRVKVKFFGSCFAAGTAVATLTGPRPIESLQVGDLVLSQDTATGALSFEPIVDIHHNPPDRTLQIRLKEETIVSTTYHRFWRPGLGWAMARELKAGDVIRTLEGRTEVLAVEQGPEQPVFNLDVARNFTFFVGAHKELVHDNSLPPPVLTPFDAEPSLASMAE